MRKSVKEKWLKALRSGEYKQTKQCLKDEVGYCCLGVLCDLHSKSVKKKGFVFKGDKLGKFLYDNCHGCLSDIVEKWAGIDHNGGCGEFHYKNGKLDNLANLNDKGKSFKQIANIIEKYF